MRNPSNHSGLTFSGIKKEIPLFFQLLMHKNKTDAIIDNINLLIEVNNCALILLSTRTRRNNNHRNTGPAIKHLNETERDSNETKVWSIPTVI